MKKMYSLRIPAERWNPVATSCAIFGSMDLARLTCEANGAKTSTLIVFVVFANERRPYFIIQSNNALEVMKLFDQGSAEQSLTKTFPLALSAASKVHCPRTSTTMAFLKYWLEAQPTLIDHASRSDGEDPVRTAFGPVPA